MRCIRIYNALCTGRANGNIELMKLTGNRARKAAKPALTNSFVRAISLEGTVWEAKLKQNA